MLQVLDLAKQRLSVSASQTVLDAPHSHVISLGADPSVILQATMSTGAFPTEDEEADDVDDEDEDDEGGRQEPPEQVCVLY